MTTLALLCLIGGAAPEIPLSVEGTTEYVIVIADEAISVEQTAALELKRYLEQVTGAVFPVYNEKEAPDSTRRIAVGQSSAFRAAYPEFDYTPLASDGIVMRTRENTLYLAGGRPRGTLYAVYTFLEDIVGCRWWTSTEEFVPSRPSLSIAPLDTVYAPKLMYREAFYRDAFDGTFAARLKCNGHFESIPPEYGGHYSILGWCHTFYQLLPAAKYFAAHPDWYSEIDGKRTPDGAQLCLTNDAMRAELTRNALEWIREKPDAGIISIAQNDCGGACQCPTCKAAEQEEGAPSGPLIRFVNAVAEDVEREFPEVWVETLAYQYTRKAPALVKPRRNVIVRLCTIECSFVQPLERGPQNETFRKDIEAWSAIAPRLYIWDYVTNFSQYLLPHPNMRVLAPNIRFFVKNNAVGLFEQGDAGCNCGDFTSLRAWLLAHLMWDPSLDPQALTREFLRGYYGAAADALGQYLDLIHNAAETSGAALPCYLRDTSAWLPLEDLNGATVLFDAAKQAVTDDPVLSERVRRARMVLDYAWLNRYPSLSREALLQGKPFMGPHDPVAFCDAFIQAADHFNLNQYREGGSFKEFEPVFRSRFRPPVQPPIECAALAETDWIDIQDNEFSLYGQGVCADIADDPNSSDGKAARMPADHTQWAIQYSVPSDIAALGPLSCHVVARADVKAPNGQAFALGIYDPEHETSLSQRSVPIEEIADGAYRTIDLGSVPVTAKAYVWVAPANNPEQVAAIYVDRMFFTRNATK